MLSYNDHPARYDPALSPLRGYLMMAAYRDFQNAWSKERRHTRLQMSLSDEAFRDLDIPDRGQDLDILLTNISAEKWVQAGQAAFTDPIDRQIMLLMANGVRSTERYARVLGILALPRDEQARQVKRVKDRITKRLRRLGEASNERP
jgi:hypothetical protein